MRFNGSEEQLVMIREIADNISDGVFLVDKMFNVWYANRTFEAIVGARINAKGREQLPCYKLLGLDICESRCVMKEAISAAKAVRVAEIRGIVKSGLSKNFHVTALPLLGVGDTPFGSLIFVRDVTAETEVQEKYRALMARNQSISLSGRIETGNLPDVVQLFGFLQRTGKLEIIPDGVSNKGAVWFDKGKMKGFASAQCKDAAALDEMLGWSSGNFSFSSNEAVPQDAELAGSGEFLMMDLVRERDELAAHADKVPDDHMLLSAQGDPPPEDRELEVRVWQALHAGAMTLPALAETLGCARTSAALAVLALTRKNALLAVRGAT